MSEMQPVRVGVVGCGAVSGMYLPILARVPQVTLVAVSDLDDKRAQAAQERYGVPKRLAPEQIFADPEIELVVNLTPIPVHVETTAAALRQGKHVYSEKPLATTSADAKVLLDEARNRRLCLACAPDTLLGSGFQASRDCVQAGSVGRVIGARGLMLRGPVRRPYGIGTNPFFDMGPYYVSALVNLFGQARRVTATVRTAGPEGDGQSPVALTGIIDFDPVSAQVDLVWGTTQRSEVTFLDVYGSEGIVHFPNPNYFGDPGFIEWYADGKREEIDGTRQPEAWPRNLRGLGVADLAQAIREGRKPRAAADIAGHVVEIIAGLAGSAEQGRHIGLETSCEPAAPLSSAAREELVG